MIKLTNFSLEMDELTVFEDINFYFGHQAYLLSGSMIKRKSLLLEILAEAFTSYHEGIEYIAESGVAYLPNKKILIEGLSVKQNLEFYAKFYSTPHIKVRVIINHFELEHLLDRKVNTLSADATQLVRIACVLINTKASVYLLDNIFDNLKKNQIDLVKNYLKLICDDSILIFSKHNTHEIEDFNPRVVEIKQKKLVYEEE